MTRTDTTKPVKPEQPEADAEAPDKDDLDTPEAAKPEAKAGKADAEKDDARAAKADGKKADTKAGKADAEKDHARAAKADGKKADAEKDDSEKGDSGTETGKRAWARVPGRPALVRATVAGALVGSVVTAGLQWYQADRAAKRDAERQEVRARAAAFGEALLSYDHTKLQDARNRVLGLASDDFAKTYDEAFTGGLEGVITKLKANATATVRTVYLGEIESGTAKAVVVMDSEVKSTAGTRRVLGSYLDMRLTRSGDDWKVTEVTSVGAANESMTDPKGEQKKPEAGLPSPAPSP